MDDREVLDAIRRGDHNAFDTVFRANYAPLVGFAETFVRERAVAEEVVQDVMLELWRRRGSLVIQESLRAYLFRATRNRALNHVRHERVERAAEPQLSGPEAVDPVGDSGLTSRELENAVRAAIASLPPRCREVFELSRVRGLRYAEIAATLGISVKTVETQMSKALQVMREKLAEWVGPPSTSTR